MTEFGEKKYQNEPTQRFKDKKRNKDRNIKNCLTIFFTSRRVRTSRYPVKEDYYIIILLFSKDFMVLIRQIMQCVKVYVTVNIRDI